MRCQLREWKSAWSEREEQRKKINMVDPNRPHTFDPQSLYLAHLSPYLQQVQHELEQKIEETQTRNQSLGKEMLRQRDEVENMVGGLESVIRDLESANQVLGECTGEGMEKEILEMDAELHEEMEGKTRGAARL